MSEAAVRSARSNPVCDQRSEGFVGIWVYLDSMKLSMLDVWLTERGWAKTLLDLGQGLDVSIRANAQLLLLLLLLLHNLQ